MKSNEKEAILDIAAVLEDRDLHFHATLLRLLVTRVEALEANDTRERAGAKEERSVIVTWLRRRAAIAHAELSFNLQGPIRKTYLEVFASSLTTTADMIEAQQHILEARLRDLTKRYHGDETTRPEGLTHTELEEMRELQHLTRAR